MNLTVSTNRRRYYLEYSVSSRKPNRYLDDVMYAVRFTYPPAKQGDTRSWEELITEELAKVAQSRPEHRLLVWVARQSTIRHRRGVRVAAASQGYRGHTTAPPTHELRLRIRMNDTATSVCQ